MNDFVYDSEAGAWQGPDGQYYDTSELPGSSLNNTQTGSSGSDWFSSINKFGQTAAQLIGLAKGKPTATQATAPAASQLPKWLLPAGLAAVALVIVLAVLPRGR